MSIVDEFEWRGMLYDASDGTREMFERERVTAYVGFDPTASSLHVGSLLPIMALARLQRAGHSPIALVGGGTGLIGDPSGKSQERTLLSTDTVDANVMGMRAQLERFLDFDSAANPARLINNADWLRSLSLLEFLRDTGKHFTVNYMLAKESVKRRLGGDEGISFTEFSYLLLQSYDYLVLHQRLGCNLQMGGSDQWGNITAGCDLIRKVAGGKAHGLVFPLVVTSSGTKFGKTEAGTVWLDPVRTSPFRFYQFWLNTDDRDVVKYLKFFTWLDRGTIADLEATLPETSASRVAQRTLAREVTSLVHGEHELARAEKASAVLFGGSLREADPADLLLVFDDVPSTSMTRDEFERLTVAAATVGAGLAASKAEASRLIKQGGLYLNGERVNDDRRLLTLADTIDGRLVIFQKGQRERRIVRLEQA
ncbi:MAG TPA: tyrosine--tRNA ligase [Thermomicrobiales bacterium]|nr:tyrosine--tRNA ligase [Thermomicrobiales bacterium]